MTETYGVSEAAKTKCQWKLEQCCCCCWLHTVIRCINTPFFWGRGAGIQYWMLLRHWISGSSNCWPCSYGVGGTYVLTLTVRLSFSGVATTLLGSRRTANRTSSSLVSGLPTAHSMVVLPDRPHEYFLPCRITHTHTHTHTHTY